MIRMLALLPLLATSLSAQVAPIPPTAPTAPSPASAPQSYRVAPMYDESNGMTIIGQSGLDYAFNAAERAYAFADGAYSMSRYENLFDATGIGRSAGGPVMWAQGDPADSLYKNARDQLNRGDYRRASDLFKSLPAKFPNSAYVADAEYWQAFALYRIGGTPELQEALGVLETFSKNAPLAAPANQSTSSGSREVRIGGGGGSGGGGGIGGNSSGYGSVNLADRTTMVYSGNRRGQQQADASALAARIASVLSSRGMAENAAVKRALAASGGNSCDQEDQSVRAEALNALMQNDPETGRQMAAKILGNRDECSVSLRRNAVMVVAGHPDASATTTLIGVLKNDPSPGVRSAAMDYLLQQKSDAGTSAVLELLRTGDADTKRAAVRSLSGSTDAKVRTEIRTLIESSGTDQSLRVAALDGLERGDGNPADAAWLRGLYGKSQDRAIKERIISILSRTGGDANNQWLMALVQNDDESLESRSQALERVGRTMDLPTLIKMYDASSQRPIREAIIQLLGQRKEPEALDKLADIARAGTDPSMRREAISILARSKDPRASALLLKLVDR